MSLKPLKKSDLGKDWVRKDRYVRKIGIQPEYHLIVTEGTGTEPNYFETIKKIIKETFSSVLITCSFNNIISIMINTIYNYPTLFINEND